MQLLGLLGYPLTHSHSPIMINRLAHLNDWPISYHPFSIHEEKLSQFIDSVTLLPIKGFNVTIPYKRSILSYCDESSPDVLAISAANTIVNDEGNLFAHNTDVFGFDVGMADFGIQISDLDRSLILGAGGAARAAAYVLAKSGCRNLLVATRDLRRENEWKTDFPAILKLAQVEFCRLNSRDLADKVPETQLVVQSTPVGTFPRVDETLEFPFECLNKDHLVFDLIYNPDQTRFMLLAGQQGATTRNGLTMLAAQAVKSLEIWGFETKIEDLKRILRQVLEAKAQ